MEHEGSSPCSQQPTDSPSQEPDDTRPHSSILFHYAQFYYPPIYDKVSHVVSFLQVSPTKTHYISILPHTGEHSRPSNPPWFDHSSNIWQEVQIIKFLHMLLSPASCHFLPLTINYLPQYHILEQPQPTFFPDGQVSAVAKSRTLQVQTMQYE